MIINAAAMTELGDGLYVYSYPISATATAGVYTWYCDSATEINPDTGDFVVGSVWDTNLSDHTVAGSAGKKLNDVRNSGGGGGYLDSVWDGNDIKKLWKELGTIKEDVTKGFKKTEKDFKPLLKTFSSIIQSIIKVQEDLKKIKFSDEKTPKFHNELIFHQNELESKLDELTKLVVDSMDVEILEDYGRKKSDSTNAKDKA
ncbi:MAG: hypothetical protein P9X24_04630 [Candidatus Hatepunaea meridiana]|nr:hypothetical protein [Candidatus Hatepunaea meridiana]